MRWKHRLFPLYRLAVVVVVFASIHAMQRKHADPGLEPGRLMAEARLAFPGVASIGPQKDGFATLLDAAGEPLGYATRTFPEAASVTGYVGASDLLVLLDTHRRVRAVRPWSSPDTAGHVDKVKADDAFWRQWNGKSEAELGTTTVPPLVVSGATLTSQAMARGLAARFGAKGMEERYPEPLVLDEVKPWYPTAGMIVNEKSGTSVVWRGQERLGVLLRSPRMGVAERGFNGANDVVVALDATEDIVLGVMLKGSHDNQPYVGDVREDLKFTDAFVNKRVADLLATDETNQWSVSGATVTSDSVNASVREMLRRHRTAAVKAPFDWKMPLAFTWIGAGLLLGLTRARSRPGLRKGFAVLSVILGGVLLGLMVGQDQLVGWAKQGGTGSTGSTAWPLVLLSAAALLVPVTTGKNVYCAHLCPHGAAQTLLGGLRKKRHALGTRWHAAIGLVPWLTLLGLWALAFLGSGWPLSQAEPFEVWSAGFYALVPTLVFAIGLLAAAWLPQGYCHYGCPTGALLKFLTHAPGRWLWRDTLAGALAAASAAWSYLS